MLDNKTDIGKPQLSNLVFTLLVMGGGFVGFLKLPPQKAVLWLLFLIVAYPPCLAITVNPDVTQEGVIEMYRLGLTQVPILGTILGRIFGPQDSVNRVSGEPTSGRLTSDESTAIDASATDMEGVIADSAEPKYAGLESTSTQAAESTVTRSNEADPDVAHTKPVDPSDSR